MADPSVLIKENLELGLVSDATLKVLIQELDAIYPDICPDHSLPHHEIAYRAGQVSVVRYLKSKLEND
jgi:hypothetical protein